MFIKKSSQSREQKQKENKKYDSYKKAFEIGCLIFGIFKTINSRIPKI